MPEVIVLPDFSSPRMSGADLAALEAAVAALERTSFAQRIAQAAGRQLGFAGRAIPPRLQAAASAAAIKALSTAMRVALSSLRGRPQCDAPRLHRNLAMASGAIGGAVGLASLPLELPLSTIIMLRSIAEIARNEGEDLHQPEAALACLEVFALSGHAGEGDLLEGGYLAVRGLLAKSVSDATRYVAARGVIDEAAPAMVRLIGQIAARFGLIVSRKTAAQAVPLVGAISGAAINFAFTDHFQNLARGHFAVRRLERAYGAALVRAEYAKIVRTAGFSSAA